ncbi:potassium uptake protein, TrkH family [Legionella oakridgensis ATCC 33761 = DSM 21215]|uniref:Trk system potassium uptake protein n=3 Tax=Legionella oakridgensis TaxID=29423 RepID=W0BBD7_9GAMM|nr:TrkH family potassium uptake protein [Legionella oakridgensis]AHE66006.1 potassium uptake protein, TrkH family [Legionella oakridgensis ATCC 33761 = DSM 21215]ETO94239.1 potassium uptake protein, TrkH family [Legionella oakridgensis RV-2-2007]KTD43583.1 Trk system potassium uptake protein TrkH [Legionella oakridgensis]STY15933.1 Trk system potassium uptake protein trkG [Legionella longbeachae]
MQIRTILRLIGLLLMMFSLSMLTPLPFNFIFHEHFWVPFIAAFLCTASTGASLWLMFHKHRQELKIRDGFLIVVLFWFVLCFFASLPFLFALHTPSMTDALFESVSGFTTTGATIITNIEALPHALLYYRQQLQFLGGMGIIVLAVAILPMLGVGGMQLYRAETPGPMKETKLTPRIAQTAKALWFIYFLLTLLCMACYSLAGMDWFDALGESFATVSTGGFSMHDASFSYYQSNTIELIACFFMLLGGTNFALHFIALKKRTLKHYWQDEEFRCYIRVLFIASFIVVLGLVCYGFFHANHHALIKSLFNVISLATTTGFISAPFGTWPTFIPILILFLAIIGGCAASTSGGIKMLRALLLYKQSKREMSRLLHPHGVIPIKFGNHTLAEPVLQSMWGFISVFIALFLTLMILLLALGNDFITTFSAITATLANAGAGIGTISITFADLNLPSKWVLMFAMIAGRLEIFSLLILFSRQFWQK